MMDPIHTPDLPVHLRIAPSASLTDLSGEPVPVVVVSVKSDLMESYDNAQLLENAGDIRAVHAGAHGLLAFSIGADRRLHLVRGGAGDSAFWQHAEVGKQAIDALASDGEAPVVQSFGVAQAGGAVALLLCVARGGAQEIFLADRLDLDAPERTPMRRLGVPAGKPVEGLQVLATPTEAAVGEVHYLAITGSAHGRDCFRWFGETWRYMQPAVDHDQILDIQLGNTKALGPGVYTLFVRNGRRRFAFTDFEADAGRREGAVELDLGSDDLVGPRAFAVDTLLHGPDRGFTEVYLVDEVAPRDNVVRYLSVAAQSGPASAGPRWERVGDPVAAEAAKVFVTHNDAGRKDLYVHSVAGGGELLHLFRNEATGNWSPTYTLEKGVQRVAPASSASGRVCEILGVGQTADDMRYLWQDAGTSAWSRDAVRVRATDRAVPVRAMQTRITFNDSDGAPIRFQQLQGAGKLTLTASESVDVRINETAHRLTAGIPVEIDSDTLVDGLDIVTNTNQVDCPFFTLDADFFGGGALTFFPLGKVKDHLEGVKAESVLTPVDRFGDALPEPLVDGERADPTYLAAVLTGVNELARLKRKSGPAAANLFGARTAAMRREGVWFEPAGTPFDSRIDLEALPDGYAFGIDFSGEMPVFLDGAAARALGPVDGASRWEDLAKWFGAFVEGVRNTAERIVRFTAVKVFQGVEFAVNIAGKWVTALAKTVEQAMQAIGGLMQKTLGILIGDLLRWLGAIFDLGYIREVQKAVAGKVKEGLAQIAPMFDRCKDVVLAQLDGVRRSLTEGRLLFSAPGVRAALEAADEPRLRSIFEAHGSPIAAGARARRESADEWLLDDGQNRWIVRANGAADEVRLCIGLPGSMAGRSGAEQAGEVGRQSREHLGRDEQERSRNAGSVDDRQAQFREDPVMNWVVGQLKQLPSLGIPDLFEFDLGAELSAKLERFFRREVVEPLTALTGAVRAQVEGLATLLRRPRLTLGEVFEYVGKNLLELGLQVVRGLFSAVLTILSDVSDLMAKVLTGRLNMPFVRALFALACPDVPFTIVDAMALVVAVPSALLLKLAGVRLPADVAEAPPAWLKIVFTWTMVASSFVSHLLTQLSVSLNWLTSAVEPPPPPARIAAAVVQSVSAGIGFFSNAFAVGMFLADAAPTAGLALHEYNTRIAYYVVRSLDLLSSGGLALLGMKAGLDVSLISLARSCFFAVVEGATQVVLLVFRLVIRIPKGEAWGAAESALFFASRCGSLSAGVMCSIGNTIRPRSKPEVIAKALFHGSWYYASSVSLLVQTTRSVGETVRLSLPPAESTELALA